MVRIIGEVDGLRNYFFSYIQVLTGFFNISVMMKSERIFSPVAKIGVKTTEGGNHNNGTSLTRFLVRLDSGGTSCYL